MPKKKKEKQVKPPATFVKERKELVGRLLKNAPRINWIIELGISKRLFGYYPFPEFWKDFELPAFLKDMDSLKVLCGEWGLSYIRKMYNIFLFKKQNQNPQEILLEDNKIGENFEIIKKNKSIRDFLV